MKCKAKDCKRKRAIEEGYCRTHGYLRPSQRNDGVADDATATVPPVQISNDIKQELQKIYSQLKNIENGLRYEVNSLNNQVDELTTENDNLKREVLDLQKKTNTNFFLHDAHNQHGRLENFRLHNEPEVNGENTLDVVIRACQKIGVKLAAEDVQRCHRLGKARSNGTNRQIICRLRWYGKKEQIMAKRKLLAPNTENKSIDERKRMMANAPFFTEDMTPFRGKIFRFVKKWNKNNDKWEVVTTNYGKICCKVKNFEKKWVTITNTDDFLTHGIPYDEDFIKEFGDDVFITT